MTKTEPTVRKVQKKYMIMRCSGGTKMEKENNYIRNLKMEEVPWDRITTAYGTAKDFPEYFTALQELTDLAQVSRALGEITDQIEHQSTLWHATPFAMIFLVRSFERAVDEWEKNEVAQYVVEKLLGFFEVIIDCVQDWNSMSDEEQEEPLPEFFDLLKEEYLLPEDCDEEEVDEWWEEGVLDDLLYSFYFYSHQMLLFCRPVLKRLENTPFQDAMEEVLKGL